MLEYKNMVKPRNNRFEVASAVLVLLLSLCAMIAGAIFCYFGITQILDIADIDVNVMLRNPSEYMFAKRTSAMNGLQVLIPGLVFLLISITIASLSISRIIALTHESRAIMELEKRVEKLEKAERSKTQK